MNKLLIATLLTVAASGVTSAAAVEPAYELYQRVVLGQPGQTSAPSQGQMERTGSVLMVPGPYARYLMRSGVSEADAVARARDTTPTFLVSSARRPLTPYERYEHAVLGRTDF